MANCDTSVRFLCLNVGGSRGSSAQTRHCVVSKVTEISQPHVVALQECGLSTNNLFKFFGFHPDKWEVTPGDDARILWDTSKTSRVETVGAKRVEWLISKCIRKSELEDETLAPWSPRHRSRFVLLRLSCNQPCDLVLVVCWHGPNRGKGLNEKKRKEIFTSFLLLVHHIKLSLMSEAEVSHMGVVLAGDFNMGIKTAQIALRESSVPTGYVIPRYAVSNRRCHQTVASRHCIDYFVLSEVGYEVSAFHLDNENSLVKNGATKVNAKFIVDNCGHLDHDPVMSIIQWPKEQDQPRTAKSRGGPTTKGEDHPLVQPLSPASSYGSSRLPHPQCPVRRRFPADETSNQGRSTGCCDCFPCETCTIL